MGLGATLGVTLLVLLTVLIPVTVLATRGRRQLRRLGSSEAAALPPGLRQVESVDPAYRELYAATRELEAACRKPARLGAEYLKVIPMLEVMDGARSSPRVYPSNWIGELMDAFFSDADAVEAVAKRWQGIWETTPQRVRSELLEERAALRPFVADLEGGALRLRRVASNAFQYATRPASEAFLAACRRVAEGSRQLMVGLTALRANPYR